MKEVRDIYGNSLIPYFEKQYGDRANEMFTLMNLLANTFYFAKNQYHRDDISYFIVCKTFNRGMGRTRFIEFKNNTFYVNTNVARKNDIERLNKMIADNDLPYSVVKKSYNSWSRTWED